VDKKEVTIGDTVTISVEAEDSDSGIKEVYAVYYTPITKRMETVYMTYNSTIQKYEGNIEITENIESGLWEIRHIYLKDNIENVLYQYNGNTISMDGAIDLSSGDFKVVEDDNPIKPLAYTTVTKNENWS